MIGACRHQYNREIIIDDISKAKTDTIHLNLPSHQSICKKILRVKGQANGSLRVDGYELSAGKIDTVFIMAWDSSSYILRYIPIDATEGILKIEFELESEVNF